MDRKWRRFAPIGLYLALIAAVAAVLIFFVQREWNLILQISIGLCVLGLAGFVILDPDRVRRALSGRHAKYGSNAIILSLAFVGILIILNYLIYQNPIRRDLTEDKKYTLTVETIDTLDKLESPVFASAFYTPRTPSDATTELLDQYKYYSKSNFDYQFIDPEVNPIAAEQAKITRDGTVVVRLGEHQEAVTLVSEQEITNAIIRLMNPEEQKIYFLTGHGEYNPEDTGERGYSEVKRTLESKNYTIDTLNLFTDDQIPDDAKVIVIAGPVKPLAEEEIEKLKEFLDEGGSVIAMQEPLPVTEFEDQEDLLAGYLSENWGVVLGEDIVIDPNSPQPFAPFAGEYGSHPITAKLARLTSVFPTVRSAIANKAPSGISQVELVKTGANTWAESDLEAVINDPQGLDFDGENDKQGPVSLAVAAEKFEPGSRLVVFGDSDFANDSNFFAYANGDLLINSIDWAIGQEDLINLTPKQTTQRFMLPINQINMNLILLGTIIVLPGLALLAGFIVWFQRRQRR